MGQIPHSLIETAKSPIRLNPAHSSTVFRVRLDNLEPQTTYYYTVDSMEATGKRDGVKSSLDLFTTVANDPLGREVGISDNSRLFVQVDPTAFVNTSRLPITNRFSLKYLGDLATTENER
jgi:hypothetical protein